MEKENEFISSNNLYVVKKEQGYAVYCQGRQSTDQIFDTLEAARSHIAEVETGISFAQFVRAGVGS